LGYFPHGTKVGRARHGGNGISPPACQSAP
jgi:hypothetical protein